MNILHLDTSILGGNSVSRMLSKAVVDKLAAGRRMEVTYRDLSAQPIPHLSGEYLGGLSADTAQFEPALQQDIAAGTRILEEFLATDIVVLGVAFYNFGIPSQLKAWIDRITVAGKTFRYAENGPEGLAGDKRLILAIARGGFYGPGSDRAAFEHAESYLRTLFGFLGVTNLEVVAAEGVALGPDHKQQAVDAALREIDRLSA
ncbi:FMN-dependent NADH-azoreductase [Sphingobium lactosutens]|jgi:FMN-dependent NADH-azoreductase|uniref:FMN dependent NADH:quinone oxidoreductase n=1 Tax=Sphingobium lactosutens DS20 TaxID=1331060 RepID=T0HYM9_9SPHN|nr:NAD(P)H-dependent oxidoreductase [Sphingobium lactosutens]EQB17163.1 hypothetical protein RLDS_04215 [Sphingobium lactosutens DS20]